MSVHTVYIFYSTSIITARVITEYLEVEGGGMSLPIESPYISECIDRSNVVCLLMRTANYIAGVKSVIRHLVTV